MRKHRNNIKFDLGGLLKSNIKYLFLILLIVFMSSIYKNFSTINRAKNEVEKKKIELEKIKAENEKLKNEKDSIGTDIYKEIQLRDKLGYAKEGEIVVILPSEEILRKIAPKFSTEEIEVPDPNWKKWLKLFQ